MSGFWKAAEGGRGEGKGEERGRGGILLSGVTRMKERGQLGHGGQTVFSDVPDVEIMAIHTGSFIF